MPLVSPWCWIVPADTVCPTLQGRLEATVIHCASLEVVCIRTGSKEMSLQYSLEDAITAFDVIVDRLETRLERRSVALPTGKKQSIRRCGVILFVRRGKGDSTVQDK